MKSEAWWVSPKTLGFLGLGIILMGLVPLVTGCIDKTVYPTSIMTIVSVTPDSVPATLPVGTATPVLPNPVAIKVSFYATTAQVPTKLVGYSITYKTRLGQPIPELTVPETPVDLYLGVTDTDVSIRVYTNQVFNVYQQTLSDIEPILATILLTFNDVNHNTIQKEAHCQLQKPR